jgi:hypothetical protein
MRIKKPGVCESGLLGLLAQCDGALRVNIALKGNPEFHEKTPVKQMGLSCPSYSLLP